MPGTQPFSPDDAYCVYCHAPAAGPCAVCGAVCCGDCVELTMGLTVQRAVCRDCLRRGHHPGDAHLLRWFVVAALVLAAGVVAFLAR